MYGVSGKKYLKMKFPNGEPDGLSYFLNSIE